MDYTKLNLHYLRIYARDIGVKSPCSYRKNELILKIKEVESGLVKPYFSKVGRPASKQPNINDVKKQRETNVNGCDKNTLLFLLYRVKNFLEDLEKEILDME